MTRFRFELLRWEIKKLEHICRVTRKTHKRTKFQSEFQGRLNQAKREARHHILVLCFCKGVPYRRVENSCRVPPDVRYLKSLIYKYNREEIGWDNRFIGQLPPDWEKRLEEWFLFEEK